MLIAQMEPTRRFRTDCTAGRPRRCLEDGELRTRTFVNGREPDVFGRKNSDTPYHCAKSKKKALNCAILPRRASNEFS
jgi:hypothetical protein